MKNGLFILMSFLMMISCKAQIIGTLEQFEECSKRPNHDTEGCPDLENITYVKDTNNRLNQFVGTWKGSYGGKQYEITLEKKVNYKDNPNDDMSWDRIIGRILVKDSQGNILYNSTSYPDGKTYFGGYNFQGKTYVMHFVGNYNCLESGSVFIYTKNGNPNEMVLFYSQDSDMFLVPSKCPNYSSFTPLLPSEKMTLVKQ